MFPFHVCTCPTGLNCYSFHLSSVYQMSTFQCRYNYIVPLQAYSYPKYHVTGQERETNARHLLFIMRFILNAKSNSLLCGHEEPLGNRTLFPVDKEKDWEAAQVACAPTWNGVQLLISFVCYSIGGWRWQGGTGRFFCFFDPTHLVRSPIQACRCNISHWTSAASSKWLHGCSAVCNEDFSRPSRFLHIWSVATWLCALHAFFLLVNKHLILRPPLFSPFCTGTFFW